MILRICCSFVAVTLAMPVFTAAQEWKSGVEWQPVPVVTPGVTNDQPPSDAIVLFGGQDLSAFVNGEQWLVQDGVATAQATKITSKQHFGDVQLHVEWSAPTQIEGEGQGRGNSGVYLMNTYEIQVLDSFQNETYADGQAGSVYKQTPPMANAMRKPGEWNTYDIFFTAPVFKSNGDVERPAYVTLLHNGVLLLNHFELLGPTGYVSAPHYVAHAETGPITFQFHRDAVRFRNIWVRQLKPAVGKRTSAPFNIEPTPPPADPKESEQKDAAVEAAGAGKKDNGAEGDDQSNEDSTEKAGE